MDRRDFLKLSATVPLAGCAALSQPEVPRDLSESQHVADIANTSVGSVPLSDFFEVSQELTGERHLNVNVAADYLQLLATHPEFGPLLPKLTTQYRQIRTSFPAGAEERLAAALRASPELWSVAEQIIYLWYVAAMYVKNPLAATSPANVWQPVSHRYADGLVWTIVSAHAPSTYGGPYGEWAKSPK